MTDIRTVITEDGGTDWELAGDDLVLDKSPETQALISVYTFGRAGSRAELPDPRSRELKGYWADTAEFRWGSLLWLTYRSTLTVRDTAAVRQAVLDALQWWIQEDIAETISVTAERHPDPTTGVILLTVTIVRGDSRGWPSMWEELRRNYSAKPGPGVELRLLTAY